MRKILFKKAGVNLGKQKMQAIKGGNNCGCGCCWIDQKGSNSMNLSCSNADRGISSSPSGKQG